LSCACAIAHSIICSFSYGAITHSLTHLQHNDSYITSPCCFFLHNNTLCVGIIVNLCKRIWLLVYKSMMHCSSSVTHAN
jgi:hypothetical protein